MVEEVALATVSKPLRSPGWGLAHSLVEEVALRPSRNLRSLHWDWITRGAGRVVEEVALATVSKPPQPALGLARPAG